jgi:AcrR family transcriptional regulator
MPKLVDHEKRRAEIARSAAIAIGNVGIDGVKIVDIAAAVGCSIGAVMHYYGSKDALLLAAMEHVAKTAGVRFEADLESQDDLVAALAQGLPISDESRLEWQVWLSFWGFSRLRDHVARAQARLEEHGRVTLLNRLEQAAKKGEIRDDLDLGHEAEAIIALIDGISLAAVLNPMWTPERQIAQLRRQIDSLQPSPKRIASSKRKPSRRGTEKKLASRLSGADPES